MRLTTRKDSMRLAAWFIGLFVAALGVLGIAAPEGFLRTAAYFQTPPGIYLAAVIRVVIGVVLFGAAPESRAPKTLRVLGAIITLAGLLTPLIGLWGGRAILDWWAAQGPRLLRVWGLVAVALGVFIVSALVPRRRAV